MNTLLALASRTGGGKAHAAVGAGPVPAPSGPRFAPTAAMEQPSARDPVRRDLSETERRWHELITELDAIDDELFRLQPPGGALITPEIFDRIEAARQRRYKLHATMIDFLDTLDDMPP